MRLFKSSFAPTSISVLVVALLLFPTSSLLLAEEVSLPPLTADSYWAWAEKKGTAQAYRFFVYHYPKDALVEKAKERWEELDFKVAGEKDNRSAWRFFYQVHPGSSLVSKIPQDYLTSQKLVMPQSALPFYRKATDTLCSELTNGVVRECAAVALGELQPDSAPVVDSLVLALRDTDSDVREAAAEALGTIGDLRVVEPLASVIADSNWGVCDSAARALGRIGQLPDIDQFRKALEGQNGSGNSHVAAVFGMIGDPRAVEPLVSALKNPDYWGLRQASAEALGEIGDPWATGPLVSALSDRFDQVMCKAACALGKIGDVRAIDPLVKLMKYPDWPGQDGAGVRRLAAHALGEIGDPQAVDPLIEGLNDSSRDVRASSVEALGKIGGDRAVEALVGVLKGKDVPLWETARALANIGGDQVIGQLTLLLKDEDARVRDFATCCLGEIKDDRVVEPLIAVLRSPDTVGFARGSAATALGKTGDARAVEPLVIALKDSVNSVRYSAAETLGKIGGDRAVEPLISALKDSDQYVRENAAEALGRIGNPRAVEPLLGVFKDSETGVRIEVDKALCQIGDAQAVDPLIAALKDTDWQIRCRAAHILGQIRSSRAVEPLVATLKDADERVRVDASRALGAIGDARAVEPLASALASAKGRERIIGSKALGLVGDAHAVEPLLKELKVKGGIGPSNTTDALVEIAMRYGTGLLKNALQDADPKVRQVGSAALAEVSKKRQEYLLLNTDATKGKATKPSSEADQGETSALGKIKAAGSLAGAGDTTVLPKIKDGLKNPEIAIQCEAIDGLAKAKEQKPVAMACFKAALAETKSDTVRLKLTGELAKMQDQKAVADIKKYAKSEDPLERMYAADILGQTGKDGVADELAAALDDLDALVRVHAATAIIRTLQAQAFVANDSLENTGGTLMPSSGTKSEITK